MRTENISRRDFIRNTARVIGGAAVPGSVGPLSLLFPGPDTGRVKQPPRRSPDIALKLKEIPAA